MQYIINLYWNQYDHEHKSVCVDALLLIISFCPHVCSEMLWVVSALLAQLQIAALPRCCNRSLQLQLTLGWLLATVFSG